MQKNIEEYVDLSAEEIFKILKQRIESSKEFNVLFKDNASELSIHIDYDCKKKRYELDVAKLINLEVVDSEYEHINIPDKGIVGTGHIYTPQFDTVIISVGASGKSIRIWRYDNTLYFSRIE